MIDSIEAYIKAHHLLSNGDRILVGVSGGTDSMVLLDILHRLGVETEVAHVNYGLRGAASDGDAALVRAYCSERNIPLSEIDAGPSISLPDRIGSLQARARKIRYTAFAKIAVEADVQCVAVGHHRDDQAETVLLNIQRRAGLDGLAGMRPSRRLHAGSEIRLIRPLLESTRKHIEQYALQFDVPWRRDKSNADMRFLRARIRHNVLPALVQAAGDRTIDDLIEMASEIQMLVDSDLPSVLHETLSPEALCRGRIPLTPLLELDPIVRGWLLLRCIRLAIPEAPARKTTVSAIERLLKGPNGKRVQFQQGSIWKEREYLRFVPNRKHDVSSDGAATVLSMRSPHGKASSGRFGTVSWHTLVARPETVVTGSSEILVNRDELSERLQIRPWKPGDRFQPFGMTGTQKIKSFLREQQVESSERDSVHVLCDDDRIVWVIGHRMDDRYRIEEKTKTVVRFLHQPIRE